MANSRPDIQRFIAHLGAQLGVPLNLQDGVCALNDSAQQQAVVIEVPDHSDGVILHCRLGGLRPGPNNMQRLLCMNFDVANLHGCWLALDQQDVRLCTQHALAQLDEQRFCDLVQGFIAQAQATRTELVRVIS